MEGHEEEFSGSEPRFEAGLYRLKGNNAVFYDDTYQGFANLEFQLERGSEEVPLPDTIFIDAEEEGDPLLVYKRYAYYIKKITIFDHSRNINRRLQADFNTRIIPSERTKYIRHSQFKSGKMLKSLKPKSKVEAPKEKSVRQNLMNLDKGIRASDLGDAFYKNRRIKNIIATRKEKFGKDFLDDPKHLALWEKEWEDFQKKHERASEEEKLKKASSMSSDDIIRAYKAKGPAQKEMVGDLAKGGKVPVDPQRLKKYMDNLGDKYLVNPAAKQFTDVTRGIKRLFNDLKSDKKISEQGGYYILKGDQNE